MKIIAFAMSLLSISAFSLECRKVGAENLPIVEEYADEVPGLIRVNFENATRSEDGNLEIIEYRYDSLDDYRKDSVVASEYNALIAGEIENIVMTRTEAYIWDAHYVRYSEEYICTK